MEPSTVNISVQFDNECVKCYSIATDRLVSDLKQLCLQDVKIVVEDVFNYGVFDVLDGQFLNDDSYISEFRLQTPDGATLKPFLFKYKSRIYKKNELVPKSKQVKCLQSRTNEKKFIEAIQSNNLEKLIKLAAKGFDPNFHCHDYPNETPLSLSTKLKSDITLSKLLTVLAVNCGALLDYRTKDNSTILHRAVEHNNYAAVKTLLDLGASSNSKNAKSLTPLYLCTTMPINVVDLNIVKLLLKNQARTGMTDTHGWHEIHQVCRNGFGDMLEIFLNYGSLVDLNAKNASGNTALHVCAVNGQEECAKLLLNHGCDADSYNYANQTAYQVAIIANNMHLADVIDKFRKNDTDSMKHIEVTNGSYGPDVRKVELKRGGKGYGFILRGIKNADNKLINLNHFPALQYLESVEKDSVADVSGLKKGDFILMINDTNVVMEKHETVVELIRKSGNSVCLTVVSCAKNMPPIDDDTISTKSLYSATLPRNRIRAPLPPRRNPKTSLSRSSKRPPSVFITANEYDEYFLEKFQEKLDSANWKCFVSNLMAAKVNDKKLIECHKLLHNGFHSDPELSNECKMNNESQTNRRRKSDDETLKNMFSLIMDKKMDHDNKNICKFFEKNQTKLSCNCNDKLKKLSKFELDVLHKSLNSAKDNILKNNEMKVSKSFPANLANNNDDQGAGDGDDNSSSGISSDQETVLLEGPKNDHYFVPPPPEFKEDIGGGLAVMVLEPPPQFSDDIRSKSLSRTHKVSIVNTRDSKRYLE